jgi:hypothetical protein
MRGWLAAGPGFEPRLTQSITDVDEPFPSERRGFASLSYTEQVLQKLASLNH